MKQDNEAFQGVYVLRTLKNNPCKLNIVLETKDL